MKRTLKRKTKQPRTVVRDHGMSKVIAQIDKALTILANRR